MMTGFFHHPTSNVLKLTKPSWIYKNYACATRSSLPAKPISHRNEWSFRVYMIPLRNLVPEWNSRPGARTGVDSRRGDSRRRDILWWYHVNKCRAMRGNRSELVLARKSPRCHETPPKTGGHDISVLTLIFNLSSEGEGINCFSSFLICKVFFFSEGGVGFTSNESLFSSVEYFSFPSSFW